MNLEFLRKNKIVSLVVMFFVMAISVWALEHFIGSSQLEQFSVTANSLAYCQTNPTEGICKSLLTQYLQSNNTQQQIGSI